MRVEQGEERVELTRRRRGRARRAAERGGVVGVVRRRLDAGVVAIEALLHRGAASLASEGAGVVAEQRVPELEARRGGIGTAPARRVVRARARRARERDSARTTGKGGRSGVSRRREGGGAREGRARTSSASAAARAEAIAASPGISRPRGREWGWPSRADARRRLPSEADEETPVVGSPAPGLRDPASTEARARRPRVSVRPLLLRVGYGTPQRRSTCSRTAPPPVSPPPAASAAPLARAPSRRPPRAFRRSASRTFASRRLGPSAALPGARLSIARSTPRFSRSG